MEEETHVEEEIHVEEDTHVEDEILSHVEEYRKRYIWRRRHA